MIEKLRERINQAKNQGEFIQTPRLFLLKLRASDAADVFKWCGDCEVTKYMSYSTYQNVADVEKWIIDSGHNCFGFFLRNNGMLIGSGNVGKNKDGQFELGYNIAKSYWGCGYGTEASKAMLAYNARQGEVDFVCKHAIDNVRSANVIKKCGFVNPKAGSYTSFDGTRTFASLEYTLHVDSRIMNVDGEWFDKIVNGSKTIELRLNDDKRRNLKAGDYIILKNLDLNADLTECVVKVIALHKFDSFETLYQALDMKKC